MDLGQNTPQSYAVAKAFVLEAEAMARSVAEFNSGHPSRGYAAITEHTDEAGKGSRNELTDDEDAGATLITSTGKGSKKVYTPLQKKNWKALPAESKKKVTELEQLADKIRSGENIEVDLRTITSALTSSVAPKSEPKKCWKCKGDHVMSECPQKETIKGAPFAPLRKFGGKTRQSGTQKKAEVVAVTQETAYEDDSGEEDYYYHLNNLVTYRGCWKSKTMPFVHPEEDLFLDESQESDSEETTVDTCLITDEPGSEELEVDEQQTRQLRSLKGLSVAVRRPTNEEVAFQADLISMPHLCRSEMQRNRWQTVSVNGVNVVKGGCFDTTSTSVVWLRWEDVPYVADSKPSNDRPKLVSAKLQGIPDEKRPISHEMQDSILKSWIAAGNRKREEESGEEEDEDMDYQQLAYLSQECEDLTLRLAGKQDELDKALSQLKICTAERDHEQIQYKRALDVVRELATRDLDEAKNRSVKEMCRLQSDLERAKEELREKEKTVSEAHAEAISGSLRRALERNNYLVSRLDLADEECSQERQQAAFYRDALEKERADARKLSELITEHRVREEERVDAYRKALEEERKANSSLRRTLKDLENKKVDKELNELRQELREAEEKLLLSVEKGSRTEERLRDAEQIGKEAMEQLDIQRALTFPHDQQTHESITSEARSQGSGGQYEALADEWDEEREDAAATESECPKKRPPTVANSTKSPENKQKKAKIAQREANRTDKTQGQPSPSTPDKQAPVFDPSTMRQITPIFGQSGNAQGKEEEEEENQIRLRKRETRLRKELSKLAPQSGIDLVGYTSRRTERRDADEAAALEREKAKARRFILWNCSQAIEIRANLRVTEFSVRDVETREKMYKDVLTKSKEDGPAKFIDLLNEECKYSSHTKLTSEWLEDQVRLWLRNPKDRQKPIKLPIPPRDPVYYQRLVDEREKRELDRRSKAGQVPDKSSESNKVQNQRKEKTVKHDEEGEDDHVPGLIDDSDSEDEDEAPGPLVACGLTEEEEEKESTDAKIAEESLATIVQEEGVTPIEP